MAKVRPPKPIESFGPELFRALIEGAKRTIEFDLPYRKAVHFRMRINQLRSEMRKQGHEQYSMASQATVSISWPEGTEVSRSSRGVRNPKDINTICRVTIKPSDSDFTEVLKAAGVTIPDLAPASPASDQVAAVEEDILASYVKQNPL